MLISVCVEKTGREGKRERKEKWRKKTVFSGEIDSYHRLMILLRILRFT